MPPAGAAPKRNAMTPIFPANFTYSTIDDAITLTPIPPVPFPLPSPPSSSTNSPTPPIQPTQLPTGLYTATLPHDWCIGTVPHGGYLSTLFIHAAMTFSSALSCISFPANFNLTTSQLATLSKHISPISIHTHFLRATRPSPPSAVLSVALRKLGAGYSVFNVCIYQEKKECATSYVTLSNYTLLETGFTFPSSYSRAPYLIPPRSECVPWKNKAMRQFRVVSNKLEYRVPPQRLQYGTGPDGKANTELVVEQWVRWADYPKRKVGFKAKDLGYIGDMYVPTVEMVVGIEYLQNEEEIAGESDDGILKENKGEGGNNRWYPTLSYGMEIKRGEPEGGWEWLFVRVESRAVKGGRMDEMVEVWSEEGELVGKGGQVALVLSGPAGEGKGAKESKLT
ncbi:thioesterase-like superfamily-domain-containing protein [Kalaharituber pfeilii]|nr:thioesterase-like superfamily-domain-containing protein [Kalaharituber pfeilii]